MDLTILIVLLLAAIWFDPRKMSDTESITSVPAPKRVKAPSAASQEPKFLNWVMTAHFTTKPEEEPDRLSKAEVQEGLDKVKEKCQYWVIGEEKGEAGNTPHFQGYFQFTTAQRLSTLRRLLRVFWQPQSPSSTPEQARDYCMKEGNWKQSGTLRGSSAALADGRAKGGEKTKEKWANALECVKYGRLDDIDPQILICHYTQLMNLARRYISVPNDLQWQRPNTPNKWYCGPPNTGKSRKAREVLRAMRERETSDVYPKMCNKWWDGYDEERHEGLVLIDDFDADHKMLAHHLKIWGDRYAFLAEGKGYAIGLRPKAIIITSNWHPSDIWQDEKDLQPILDRFEVTRFGVFKPATQVTRAELRLPSEDTDEEEEEVLVQPTQSV